MASRKNYIQFIQRNISTYSRYHFTKLSPLSISSQPINPCLNLGSPSSPTAVSTRPMNPNCMLTYRFLSNKPVEPVSEVGGKVGESSGKSNSNAGKYFRSAPVTWLSFFLLAATGGGLVYYYNKEKARHIEEITTSVKQGTSVGKAAIGGPFKLVNHEGKTITEKNFCGKWTLLYFGFTHCPDICPDELIKLSAAIDKIQKAGIEVVPVFITVDPERDTVEQVRDYVQEFHPKLVGLTGSSEEIKKVARAYRVYYMKTEEEGSDYLVDHSIVMYLMDPNMEFVKFFGKNNDVDALTVGIINEIKQYKK